MKSKPYQLLKWTIVSSLVFFLFSCKKPVDDSPLIEKEINLTGFNRVYAGENFSVTITKGSSYSVKVNGPSHAVNDIDWTVANNILNIQYLRHENNRPRVDITITLPLLIQLNLSGAGTGTINGFQGISNVLRTVLSGASKCTLNGATENTQIEISGASEFVVSGATLSLYGNISGAARLTAYDLTSTEVDISASGGSEARVKVVDKLYLDVSGGSNVYYKGDPATKNIQTSDNSRVIQE